MTESDRFPETPTRLRALLESRGLAPNRRYGQNFLVDPNLLDAIAGLAELAPEDVVLEVGTGTGNLTWRLAQQAGHVISVEIDAGLQQLARDLIGPREHVVILHGDVMATKSTLSEPVIAHVSEALERGAGRRLKVVANLPYNISTPFLSALLLRFGPPEIMVLLVQRELAENLTAGPGSRAYSPLSILMGDLTEVVIARRLGAQVFFPAPKVESAVVVARRRAADPGPTVAGHPLVRFLFSARRKAVSSILRKLPPELGGPLSADRVTRVLAFAGLTGRERAEALEADVFRTVERAISETQERG